MTQDIKLPPLPEWAKYQKVDNAMQVYAKAAIEPYRQALHDLIRDLEMRSDMKMGSQKGVVDCGNGVYMKAKRALGEIDG